MGTKRWAWLTAFSLLFAGLTNAHAHVHYCFDGQEPPASVHIVDALDHHHAVGHLDEHALDHELADQEHGADGDHDDLDLDLPNQALAKSVKHDLATIAPLVVWTPAHDTARSYSTVRHVAVPPRPPPLYSRPLLRGPPR
jgi:hypothetical protein